MTSPGPGRPRPRLALIVPDLAGRPSGGQTYNACLTRALRELGYDICVHELTGNWPAGNAEQHSELGSLLTRHDTVLIDGLIAAAAPQPVRRAGAAGTQVVVLVHSPLPADTGLSEQLQRHYAGLEERSLRSAAGVLCTSHWSARDLRRRYGLRDVGVAVPGTDPAPIATGSSPPCFLVLAALTPVKNHPMIITALESLHSMDWSARFIGPAADDPDYIAVLSDQLARSPVAERIAVPGPLSGNDLEAQWQAGDLLLLPSRSETFGLVVTEALAHGIPAVVGAGTGAEEALAGMSCRVDDASALPGALVDPDRARELARTLRHWLQDPTLRSSWREAALTRRDRMRTWADTATDVDRALRHPDART